MKAAAIDCHPTAVVQDGAQIAEGVRIGPYCVVGENVSIGRDTVIEPHVVIAGYTTIGERCRIFPYASIGMEPQDLKFQGEVSTLTIGNENVFREFVTIHRGTALGGGRTVIGNGNLFMAYTHVAHDCAVGDKTIFGNAATLGGHVVVEDHATVSASSGVHQFCRVGSYSFVGGYSVVTKDVLPFSKVVGNRARLYGVNAIGLERRGFTRERIENIHAAFRILRNSGLNVTQAIEKLKEKCTLDDDIRALMTFVEASSRGVIVKRGSDETE